LAPRRRAVHGPVALTRSDAALPNAGLADGATVTGARQSAGPAGARGRLELQFAASHDGTWLRHQSSRAPLRCLRAFALPGGERLAQLLHVGPGIMAGDELELDVRVEPGAHALLVAQSAAKLHAMDGDAQASQRVSIHVAAGGSLEYHPGLTIPFSGSAFRQRIEVELEGDARFVYVERWAAGRIARAERHGYRRIASQLLVRRDGRPHYADALVLEPAHAAGPAIFDAHDYLAQGVCIGGGAAPPQPDASLEDDGAAVSVFPVGADGVALRALAHDGVSLQRALQRHWHAWRSASARPLVALDRFGS